LASLVITSFDSISEIQSLFLPL